jgi:hypothetical protein
VEDWEALYILETAVECLRQGVAGGKIGKDAAGKILAQAAAALAIDDSFCKTVTHWALDPAGLKRRRDEVSRLIEAIVAIVGKDAFAKHHASRLAARRALEDKRLRENRQRALKELRPAAK